MSATPLNQLTGMPKMRAAFAGWKSNITLRVITQTIVDGLVTVDDKDITFKGTIQPLSPQKTALKPEGQRAWRWLQIHCAEGNKNLATNDRIVYAGEVYKVMDILDYSLNGYIEYHATQDFQNE